MRRLLLVVLLPALLAPAAARAGALRAGVGRADVTPPTGYYMMGWVDSRAKPTGVWTRLFARAIVLQEDGRKTALVSMDANAVPGGLLAQVAQNLRSRGFGQDSILITASHTHAQATGFYNFSTYNTVFMSASTPTDQNVAGALDPQLYAFMVRQVQEAIARADDDLRPARAGWGHTRLVGLTANRSLEAHLADFGIDVPPGQGTISMDPRGYIDTIDPNVDVLRIDQIRGGRDVPVGAFDDFANHGTSVHADFEFYGADHHASADRTVEAAIRRIGHVPRSQDVVAAYGNADEGDQSSGLYHWGPAWADHVGIVEGRAFLRAWRAAGKHLSASPAIASRWTRVCFCGEPLPGGQGAADSTAVTGLPLFTGSEEGRGPLYDVTKVPFEGQRLPVGQGPQGRKIPVTRQGGTSVPDAVPLLALRIGDRLIVTIPGEATVGVGGRIRAAVTEAVAGSAVRRVVLAGLANEYIQYFTTPQEYDAQHYEGGSTLYGRLESLVLQFGLSGLAQDLVTGAAAPAPYAYDPTNGVADDGAPFPTGASSATAGVQPRAIARLQRATFGWTGGPRGFDRPLDRAFVTVQRLTPRGWRAFTSDLGSEMDWSVDDAGAHTARWEAPLAAPVGRYRFVVTANHYRVVSQPFTVSPARSLTVRRLSGRGPARVVLAYPAPVTNVDLTARPGRARGGRITYTAGGVRRAARAGRDGVFTLRATPGSTITIAAGAARDAAGNSNAAGVTFGR